MNALFGGARIELRQTPKAVTPFGGMAVFLDFLGRIGWSRMLTEHFPFAYRSPNGIAPAQTFTVFMLAVLSGARRFAHAGLLRADRALHAMLGLARCPGDDAIRSLFRRFGAGEVQRLFRPLWSWMLERHPRAAEGYTLFASHTVWSSKDDFVAWTKSENFRAAHRNAGSNDAIYLGHPQFEGFSVVEGA